MSKDITPTNDVNSKTRVSGPLIPAEDHERFKTLCEDQGVNQSDVLRAAIQRFIDEHGEREPEVGDKGYYPDDDQLRRLYEICLEYCDRSFKIYQQRHAGAIANEMKTFSKQELSEALKPLRKQGYVALGAMPIDLTGDAYDRRRHWHVKPACADPEQWVYSEVER
jgi:hypothetical protein